MRDKVLSVVDCPKAKNQSDFEDFKRFRVDCLPSFQVFRLVYAAGNPSHRLEDELSGATWSDSSTCSQHPVLNWCHSG